MTTGVTLLDGGLSTALAERGHRLDDDLWTARLLLDRPAEIVEAHLAFLRAGAKVLITASYQASADGFRRAGAVAAEVPGLLALPVALARRAIDRFAAEGGDASACRVAASVGPYGAVLADGSEYTGAYGIGVDELRAFHSARLAALLGGERPDLLACETIPSAEEAEVVVAVVADAVAANVSPPAWLTFSCRSGTSTAAGDPIEEAAQRALAAGGDAVVAVGVNCVDPADVEGLLRRLRSVTDLPLVAYPNCGQTWDAEHDVWVGERRTPSTEDLGRWVALGTALVGGCCGVGPADLASLGADLASLPG